MFQSIAKHFRRQKPVADPVLSRQQLSERIDTLSAEIEARGLTLPAPAEYPASTTNSTMPPTRAALLERVEQLESVLAGQSDSTSRPAGSSLPEPRAAMAERIKRLEKKLRAANVAIPPKASEQETRVQLATRLAELEDLAGLVDLREEKQNRIEQLERSIAELKSKKARQQSAAKPAVSSVQPAAGASSATPWHQWTKAERTAEATRLLSLVREDPEIAALNRQATNVTEGATGLFRDFSG